MSERGTALMTRASQQLEEVIEFFGRLDESDLGKPCPGGDEDAVRGVATHIAQGYHFFGRFLQTAGYVPGAPATGTRHKRGHQYRHGHGRALALKSLPAMVDKLRGAQAPIGLLADVTDEQLDSAPPEGSSRFSDGRLTLAQVINAVIAHQAAQLDMLKRAVPPSTLTTMRNEGHAHG